MGALDDRARGLRPAGQRTDTGGPACEDVRPVVLRHVIACPADEPGSATARARVYGTGTIVDDRRRPWTAV